jgi:hypothetical protein
MSVSRLPITGSDVFGREEDIAFLNDAWSNQQVNVVTLYVIDSGWAKRSAGRRDYA